MGGAFITIERKYLNDVLSQIPKSLSTAEYKGLWLDSDIKIRYENKMFIATFHVHS